MDNYSWSSHASFRAPPLPEDGHTPTQTQKQLTLVSWWVDLTPFSWKTAFSYLWLVFRLINLYVIEDLFCFISKRILHTADTHSCTCWESGLVSSTPHSFSKGFHNCLFHTQCLASMHSPPIHEVPHPCVDGGGTNDPYLSIPAPGLLCSWLMHSGVFLGRSPKVFAHLWHPEPSLLMVFSRSRAGRRCSQIADGKALA